MMKESRGYLFQALEDPVWDGPLVVALACRESGRHLVYKDLLEVSEDHRRP